MPDPITGIMAAGAIGSAVSNIFGAQSAADAQKQAAATAAAATLAQQQKGLDTQKNYFDQGTNALQPIASSGSGVYNNLVNQLPDLTAPITMDQATLEKTPGYQFNLSQGIRGVDLSSVSRGMSGAQAKAAATFATGLADNTYQNQFNNANINKTNAFNRLLGTAQVGTNAATSMAQNATWAGNAALGNTQTVGGQLGGYAVGAGNATAAADLSTGAQLGNAVNSVAGAYNTNLLINRLTPQAAPALNSGPLGQASPGVAGSSFYGPPPPVGMYG